MANKICELPTKSCRSTGKGYEEVHVPHLKPKPFAEGEEMIKITDMPDWVRAAFWRSWRSATPVQSRGGREADSLNAGPRLEKGKKGREAESLNAWPRLEKRHVTWRGHRGPKPGLWSSDTMLDLWRKRGRRERRNTRLAPGSVCKTHIESCIYSGDLEV